MDLEKKLEKLAAELEEAARLLASSAKRYLFLKPSSRALHRLGQALKRPLRIAILGESNSGKSTIANLIAAEMALPALPVANTRLPTLLFYANAPYVQAVYENGEREAIGASGDIAREGILRLEVGLPSEMLRNVELLDFPGSANPFFQADLLAVLRHRIDAAIWASVATQAWRETERVAWMGLPTRIRQHGILAVTHCDLIKSESDLFKLRARLDAVGRECFSAVCFVHHGSASSYTPAGDDLVSKLVQLSDLFLEERADKALAITRRIAARSLDRLEH